MLILMIFNPTFQDLPAKDSNGFSDPYAKLFYTNRLLIKTPVFPKTLAPQFESESCIP
jgi:Ca2+-dependent lipid-binding protein